MDFLYFNNKKHKYQDLFKTYNEEDFAHYHCDICETPHKSKIAALNCCSHKKVRLLELLEKHCINHKRLLKNINKLDEIFQKIEFGRDKHNMLCGPEYYPFYNEMFLKTLQEWDGITGYEITDIINMGSYPPKDCYQFYNKIMYMKAKEIKLEEEKRILKKQRKGSR